MFDILSEEELKKTRDYDATTSGCFRVDPLLLHMEVVGSFGKTESGTDEIE